MNYTTYHKELLADVYTPVQTYLQLRSKYTPCLLLESSDYHTKEHSFSLLCCDVLEEFSTQGFHQSVPEQISRFIAEINCTTNSELAKRFNSVFGYSTFEAVQSFETISFQQAKPKQQLPNLCYQFFRYVIVFNHFNETMLVLENCPEGESSKLEGFVAQIQNNSKTQSSAFRKTGNRTSNLTDQQFQNFVEKGKQHCQFGNVFQLVLSRQFQQSYEGDNFTLYRALRSINPSPFSFYFDYGEFQIFGASPEAQLLVRNGLAEIHPIAGTYKRTGNDKEDAKQAKQLFADEKENAEHIMLVDLARNDLGKRAKNIEVNSFKDVQFYSHVIHLVSKVTGKIDASTDSKRLYADTFPAGTLSGAPKFKALQIIDELEPTQRGIYGGAIGAFGLNGDVNHAIAIRTFFAQNNVLYYQAGAGIVIDSVPEKENEEVYNKLGALELAMEKAETLEV